MFPTDAPGGDQPPAGSGWTPPPPPASAYVGVPAEPAPPAPRRSRRLLKVSLAVVGTVVLVGVPSAVALFMALNRGSGDQLVRMVPANADVYSTVLLDPSLSQKRDLYSFLQHFPQLRSQQDIQRHLDDTLNDGLKSLGLDFTHDIQPWLGNQIAVAVRVAEKNTDGVFLFRASSESAATASLDKVKSGRALHMLRWSTSVHGDVTVTNGVEPGLPHSGNNMSYAVFDHVVAIATDESILDAVIDTDQGKQANLETQAAYTQTLQQLPVDHIAVVYVNAAKLLSMVRKTIAPTVNSMPPTLRDALSTLDAYRSFGAAVSAQSDAMALDAVTLTDPSRMTAAQRQALATNARRAAALDWVPQDSYGVFAATGPSVGQAGLPVALAVLAGLTVVGQQTSSTFSNISSGLDPTSGQPVRPQGPAPAAPPPAIFQGPNGTITVVTPPPVPRTVLRPATPPVDNGDPLQQLGVTGADGVEKHLTGDAAIAVGPGHGDLPLSAVMVLGTDDSAALDRFLHRLGSLAGDAARWGEQHDGDAVIHTLATPDLGGFSPSYAVLDGYAVVGTDPDAVRHSIDAHRGATANITSAPAFRGSAAANAVGGLVFIDLRAVVSAVRHTLSGSDRADFDKNAGPDLDPLRIFLVTTTADTQKQSVHVVLTVGG